MSTKPWNSQQLVSVSETIPQSLDDFDYQPELVEAGSRQSQTFQVYHSARTLIADFISPA